MLPAQKRNGLPKRKSATLTEISGPGPISLVIMDPRTEIPPCFLGILVRPDQNHPDQNRCDRALPILISTPRPCSRMHSRC